MSGTTCAWYSVPCRLGLPLDQYQVNFALLVGLCAGLFSAQQTQQARVAASSAAGKDKTNGSTAKAKHGTSEVASDRSGASQLSFLIVYALVMAADWLQGPFLYSLYAKEHAVAPTVIPQLFTTGFVSGGVAGAVVGSLADAYGRRAACLAFCVAYTVSCLLTAGPPSLPLLFLGRVLGGISTSLLFSVFEGWMVADFARRNLESKGGVLSKTFARMSTVNSVVAIASGVVSEWLVAAAGTRKAPFWASSVLLVLAGVVIAATWVGNP